MQRAKWDRSQTEALETAHVRDVYSCIHYVHDVLIAASSIARGMAQITEYECRVSYKRPLFVPCK